MGNPVRLAGFGSADINTIQYLSMGSNGNAQDFGDLTKTRKIYFVHYSWIIAAGGGGGDSKPYQIKMMEFA